MSDVVAGNEALNASCSEDGFWRDKEGVALLLAQAIQRGTDTAHCHGRCREGKSGQGDAIAAGIKRHAEIHSQMKNFQIESKKMRRSVTIWTWWFSIIIALSIDAIAFNYIDDVITPIYMARYLALWSVTTLIAGLIAISVLWRSIIGFNETINRQKTKFLVENDSFPQYWEPKGFIGGWFEAGRFEASLLFGSIVLGLHAIALAAADDRQQATFILFLTAMGWTLAESWQLQRLLLSDAALESIKKDIDLEYGDDVAYLDNDDGNSTLLVDNEIGLRGKPDQIIIVDGEFIPVEQKTGKVPKESTRLTSDAIACLPSSQG